MTLAVYRDALVKVKDAPLTLTDADFAVLAAFNPADARRGRDPGTPAQLARLRSQAAPAGPRSTAPPLFVAALDTALRTALAPVLAQLDALEAAAADFPALLDGSRPKRRGRRRAAGKRSPRLWSCCGGWNRSRWRIRTISTRPKCSPDHCGTVSRSRAARV